MNFGGTGVLILSIDLELDLLHQHSRYQSRLDEVRRQLVEITKDLQIAATWAVADPTHSAATESILGAHSDHEIAVLGDVAWLGPGCGRARLGRELARRFVAARKTGIDVRTLALRNVEQVRDLDLLLDYGVQAVRGPAVDTLSLVHKIGTPMARFGIWQPPAAWKIPPQGAWWTAPTWLIRGEIRRAIRRKALVHLEIDAPRLVTLGEPSLRIVARILQYAAAKRDAGRLAIKTIQQLAQPALAHRNAAPSHSVLRPAA
jgi:hypothetical protein